MSRGKLQTRGKLAMSNAEIRGRFVWHELMTTDTDAASDFYSQVVPWKAEDSGMPSYSLWMSGKYRAGGLMALPEDDASATPPHWIIYIGTPDVDGTVAAAEKLGGKVLKSASDIPNVGRFAVLSDPQGAAFAVFTPAEGSGDGVPPGGAVGDFTWHELSTTDPGAAFDFYAEVFGWTKGAAHDMGEMGVYQLVSHGGQDVGGVYKARDNSTPPSWLSYVRVADAAKAASAAKSAGGRILNGPIEVPGGSWVVMMLDPQGGAFAVVEPPKAARGSAGASDDDSEDSPPAKRAARKAAKKAPAKSPPAKSAPAKVAAAGKSAAKKAGKAVKKVAKVVKKAAKKVVKKAAKKVAKKAAKKSVSKPAAKRAVAKKTAAKPKAKAKAKAKGKARSKK
jgi:predicted enzyme related to lactoylglutathione lyase